MAEPVAGSAPLRWATLPLIPADVTEPDTQHKDEGWQEAEEPPHSFLNYWMNLVYLWIVYLDNITAEALTWTAAHIFQAGITVTQSSANTRAITATGNGTGSGVRGTGGATGIGVEGIGGSTSGMGVTGLGTGNGFLGGQFTGGGTNSGGAAGIGTGTGAGLTGLTAGATATYGTLNVGVYGKGFTGLRGGAFQGGDGSLGVGADGLIGTGGAGDDDGFGTLGGTGVVGQGGLGSGDIGGYGVKGLGGTGDSGQPGGWGALFEGGTGGSGSGGGGGLIGRGKATAVAAQAGGVGVNGQGGSGGSGGTSGAGGDFVGGSDIGGANVGVGVRAAAGSGSTGTALAFHGTHGGLKLDDGKIDAQANTSAHLLGDTTIIATKTLTVDPGKIPMEAEINVQGGIGFSGTWADSTNAGTYSQASYWKDALGMVHVHGRIASGTSGTVAFTLPAGYRPAKRKTFLVDSFASGGGGNIMEYSVVDVYANGEVRPSFGPGTGGTIDTVWLDQITFRAA